MNRWIGAWTLLVILGWAPQIRAHAEGNPTHSSPIAVSNDNSAVWVVNPDSGTVSKIATEPLERVAEYTVGRNPRTLELDGSHVFVAVQDDDRVVRLDQADGGNAIVRELPYGCAPYGVAVNLDRTRVFVSCERTDRLMIFDPELTLVATVVLPWPTPRGIAVAVNDGFVYVTHFLTKEPNDIGHVTEVDVINNVVSRIFDIPADLSTCETINSGQGVANLMSAIAMAPPTGPIHVANQVWVAGTRQNATKGLFKRSAFFRDLVEARRFPFPFASFPDDSESSRRRNLFKSSFHDITRAFIARIDLVSGQVVDVIDIDEANLPSGLAFSPGAAAFYAVDQTFNSFQIANTARRGTVFGGPPRAQPGSCGANAFDTQSESPFIVAPHVQLRAEDLPLLESGGIALTGLDYDVPTNTMVPIADGIGTTPIGVAISPDGARAYSANFLSRTVTAVNVAPGSFRCANAPELPCETPLDCPSETGRFCGDATRAPCMADTDCATGITCVLQRHCVPRLVGVVRSTDRDPLPPEILDGKILFNTASRDPSIPNKIGLNVPIPPLNYDDPNADEAPGTIVSTAHDGSYVACTSCHADAGLDGRSWDFSQFGASLRNTMDLRGRASLAPGTCSVDGAAGLVGASCVADADCGTGSPLGTCQADPRFVPDNNPAVAAHRERFFNPMATVHWNGDRDEVEDFEHTFRSLQGAGDCDGTEHLPERCIGALIMRSNTADPADVDKDLGTPNRAIPGDSGIAGIRLTHMADYVYSEQRYVRNPHLTTTGVPREFAARRGRAIFNDPRVGCARCHNGPSDENQQFSDKGTLDPAFDPDSAANAINNPFLRHDVGTGNVFDLTDPHMIASTTVAGGIFQNAAMPIPASRGTLTEYVTPVLIDVWNSAPYLHDGSAPTLLDVVLPCRSAVEDCNAPPVAGGGPGRNVDDRHGVTSILSRAQLADLVAFLEAPHGPIGVGDTRATLTLTSVSTGAPDFGFVFPIPIAGARVRMTIDARAGRVTMYGADFPTATFDTAGGPVTFNLDDDMFAGTIDPRGQVQIPNVGLTQTIAGTDLRFVFALTTKAAQRSGHIITGTPLDRRNGALSLVDIQLSPPDTPILGSATPTTIRISGTLDLIPMQIERAGEITGVVRDREGQPVARASVTLRGRRRILTDAAGRFRIDQLVLGSTYVVRAQKRGLGRAQEMLVLSAGSQSREVELQLR
jgi:DNA-binding beta-propeller fold protein YncE